MTAAEKFLSLYGELAALPEGMRGEIVAGELHTSPRPSVRNQAAGTEATTDLNRHFGSRRGGPGGWLFLTEPELRLGSDTSAPDFLSPDLAGWRRERLPHLPATAAIDLAPDWVCEILAPSTMRYDRGLKRARYLLHGVAWMWLIDPDAKLVEAFEARDGRWTLVGVWPGDAGDSRDARIPPFDEVPIDLTGWWID
jgi:Uma2 family endonuclease